MLANLTDSFLSSQHATIGSNTRGYSEIEAILNNPASSAEQRVAAQLERLNAIRLQASIRDVLLSTLLGDLTRGAAL